MGMAGTLPRSAKPSGSCVPRGGSVMCGTRGCGIQTRTRGGRRPRSCWRSPRRMCAWPPPRRARSGRWPSSCPPCWPAVSGRSARTACSAIPRAPPPPRARSCSARSSPGWIRCWISFSPEGRARAEDRMTDQLAVVTGAARGIGAAVARRLAASGWSLVLVDAGAPRVNSLVADVGDGAARGKIRAALGERAPAAAVAVAGVIGGHSAWNEPDDAFDLMLRVNLYGVRHLADACVPAMVAAGSGRFVAVSSAAALRAMPRLAAYSAAKAAVLAYVRAMAADLAGTGVTANIVCPGSTRGVMLEASAAVYDLPSQDTFAGQALLRRLLEPDEVAAAIAWLCSRDAGALTGAVIPVDAGLSA